MGVSGRDTTSVNTGSQRQVVKYIYPVVCVCVSPSAPSCLSMISLFSLFFCFLHVLERTIQSFGQTTQVLNHIVKKKKNSPNENNHQSREEPFVPVERRKQEVHRVGLGQ